MYDPNQEQDIIVLAEELREIVRQYDAGFEFLYTMARGKYMMFGEGFSKRRIYDTRKKKIIQDYELFSEKVSNSGKRTRQPKQISINP